jgi:hypothetical protein
MDLYSIYNKKAFLLMEAIDEDKNTLTQGFEFGTLDDALTELPPAPKEGMEEAGDIKKDLQAEPFDPKTVKEKKSGGVAAQTARLIHNSTVKAITNESGEEWDLEKLIGILTEKPTEVLVQNSKIKKSGSGEKIFYNFGLPAYHGLYFDEDTKGFKLVKTCPSAGACKAFCYAAKGGYVMFPNSSLKTGSILNFLLNHPTEFKQKMIDEIKEANRRAEKKGQKMILRWHDSGDFFNEAYTDLAFEIAEATPEVKHYAYTKQVSLLRGKKKPANFVINYSSGGTQDKDIKPTEKQSNVIPKPLFKDLDLKKSEDQEKLKDRVAEKYKLDREKVITYDELIDKPEGNKPEWQVLVWKGHGDDAATREDVINTMLLIH